MSRAEDFGMGEKLLLEGIVEGKNAIANSATSEMCLALYSRQAIRPTGQTHQLEESPRREVDRAEVTVLLEAR
jgi:hypothetical protein